MSTLRRAVYALLNGVLYANPVLIIATTALCGLITLAWLPGLGVAWFDLVSSFFVSLRDTLAEVPGRL